MGTRKSEKDAHEACTAFLTELEYISYDLGRDAERTSLVIEVGESNLRTRGQLSHHELGQLENVLKDVVEMTESLSIKVKDNTHRIVSKSRDIGTQLPDWKQLTNRVRKRLAYEERLCIAKISAIFSHLTCKTQALIRDGNTRSPVTAPAPQQAPLRRLRQQCTICQNLKRHV